MDWNSVQTTVVLPKWIWDEAKDKDHFKQLINQYMKRYPNYKIMKLGKYYAICKRPIQEE